MGSARTVRAGPIETMPRRSVGIANCSSNALPRARSRKDALEHPRADGELELHPAEPAATGVRRDEASEGRLAHDHSWRRNEQPDLARAPADQPQGRHRHDHDESPADGDDLEQPPAVPHDERDDRRGDHRPPQRRDDALHRSSTTPDRRRSGARSEQRTLDDHREQAALPGLLGNAREGPGEAHTTCLVDGGGVSMSTCAIMFDAVTPSNSASGSRISRCASTGSASALISSGTT